MVEHFDRVLDRDDVTLTGAVDVVDHGCEGGRLSAAGRSCDEYEAPRLVGQAPDGFRQVQLAEGPGMRPDQPEDHSNGAALPVGVDAEAAQARDGVGEVALVRFFETSPRPLLHDLLGDRGHLVRLDDRHIGDASELAIDSHSRWRPHFQVEIGSFCRR